MLSKAPALLEKSIYLSIMNSPAIAAIPVSPEVAARFAVLTVEQKRAIRLRVAIEIGRLSRPKSRATSAAEFRGASAAIGDQARGKGLTLTRLARMVDESR